MDEIAERRDAASQLDDTRPDYGAGLRDEAQVLEDIVRDI